MKKNYVLDTNVLINDPECIFKFQDNNVFLPIYVLEEIDNFKKDQTERGRNARAITRHLDSLRATGSLAAGVSVADGTLKIIVPKNRRELNVAINPSLADHAILETALSIRDEDSTITTVLVTMDLNLRCRADALGLNSEAYESQAVDVQDIVSGIVDLDVEWTDLDRFYNQKSVMVGDNWMDKLYSNVSVVMRDNSNNPRSALARYDSKKGILRELRIPKDGVLGVKPRNKEQSFALDLLLDDNVKLVSLIGNPGGGKTLLAIASGLKQVLDGQYTRLLVSRPIMPMGRDLGFLPGSIEEKLDPWMQPIFDNLEYILMTGGGKKKGIASMDQLFEEGKLQVEPLTYIRGRSIPQQFMIIDEAQNLTTLEIKTIITRAGENTKIVLTGDHHQIDNPYLDSESNGLVVASEKLRGETIAGHIILSKGERSELANLAADKL
jgi:PhoH-like ATPase